jgi:hypothetical protein
MRQEGELFLADLLEWHVCQGDHSHLFANGFRKEVSEVVASALGRALDLGVCQEPTVSF